MTKHYKLSPSSMGRLLACPGSMALSEGCEDRSSTDADEGTRAHEAAAAWVLTGEAPEDPELAEHLAAYAFHCRSVGDQASEWFVEQTLESEYVAEFGGTPDFAAVSEDGLTAWVYDYKHGIGVPVVAEKNVQLLAYACLLSERWPRVTNWHLGVFQPRTPGPVPDIWETGVREVDRLYDRIVALSSAPGQELHAGDHCRWCPAKAICPELRRLAHEQANREFSSYTGDEDPVALSQKIDRWLADRAIAPAVKAYLKAVDDALLAVIKKGEHVPGVKVVQSLGPRTWSHEETAILKKLARRGVGKRKATVVRLLSPTQMEKAGFSEAMEGLVERKVRGVSLVDDTDRREAIEFAKPGDEFDVIP